MKHWLKTFETCDCPGHVYGPFPKVPLSADRTFDPPESPIEALETVWRSSEITPAVLIQGSAYGNEHRALPDDISRDPYRRHGVAILSDLVSDEELENLHRGGIRAIRFNWINHLLRNRSESIASVLDSASSLCHRVFRLGWRVEVHIELASLEMLDKLETPREQFVVIDHLARVDGSLGLNQSAFKQLCKLLERDNSWVKLSGADRVASCGSSLSTAVAFVFSLANEFSDRCVWGLDWLHVNLNKCHEDFPLLEVFYQAVPDDQVKERILSVNLLACLVSAQMSLA